MHILYIPKRLFFKNARYDKIMGLQNSFLVIFHWQIFIFIRTQLFDHLPSSHKNQCFIYSTTTYLCLFKHVYQLTNVVWIQVSWKLQKTSESYSILNDVKLVQANYCEKYPRENWWYIISNFENFSALSLYFHCSKNVSVTFLHLPRDF